MTETQTDCALCGDTGFVPPFMDPCTACGVAASVPSRAPLSSTWSLRKGEKTTIDGVWHVWDGEKWQPFPTETLTATEYGAKYHTGDTVAETLAAAEAAKPVCPACGGDGFFVIENEAEGDYTEQCITCDGTGHERAPRPEPKTSKDTFAELVAACEAIPTPRPPIDTELADALDAVAPVPAVSHGTAKPITEAQEKLLRKLIAERDPVHYAVDLAQTRLDAGLLTAKSASNLIDQIMKVPADPAKKAARPNRYDGTCQTCGGPVAAEAGHIVKVGAKWVTFHNDGGCLTATETAALFADRVDEPGLYKAGHPVGAAGTEIFRVRKSRTSDRLYAEKVITLSDGAVTFLYNAKAMSFLRKSDRLTWKEARSFGAAYSACVACGRTLSDPRSLVQGYGNTCAGHYRWPTVTTKQAEAIIAGTLTWEDVTGLAV